MTNIRYANKYRIRRFLIGKLHTEIVSKKALFNNVDRPGGGYVDHIYEEAVDHT